MIRVAHELQLRLETELGGVGLSMAKAGLLRELAGSREPLALSDLAQHIHCVRSNVTQLVDRLEKDGMVRRVHDPADRRVVRAELTDAGRHAHAQAARIFSKHMRGVTEALGETDAAALSEALTRLGGGACCG